MRISVLNMKGGVGKTTTTVYLCAAAAAAGVHPVIAVDADPQGSLADWLGERPIPGVELVDAPAARLVEAAAAQACEGLMIIDTPPQVELILRAAIAHSDFALIPTGTGSPTPARVATTLTLLPPTLSRGLIVTAARTGTRHLTETVLGWQAAGERILGVVPLRVGIEAGPAQPELDRTGRIAYAAILEAMVDQLVGASANA
jgi:chromosome partitioning protein